MPTEAPEIETPDVGTGPPIDEEEAASRSSLTARQIIDLAAPLDRSRVKSREGRGRGSFDYLEGHDVIRTANRIFGFGQWGHRVVELSEIAAVDVVHAKDASKKGVHVGYRGIVELAVADCVPVSGVGYGDAVEYGAAARVTACELAMKEAETDALKRAFKNFGDQFGLILYAKLDEQRRLESQAAADVARVDAPMSVQDVLGRLSTFVEDGREWLREVVPAFYKDVSEMPEKWGELPAAVRDNALARLQTVVVALEGTEGFDPYKDPAATQAAVRAAFSRAFEGLDVKGPEPFRPPIPFG